VIRGAALAAVLSLASCGRPGLHGQIAQLRAEIQTLERDVSPDSPLWPDQGENAFNRYIEDYTPRIPDFIYNHVAAKLSTMSEADFDALAQPTTDLDALVADPTPARGKLWRVTGRIGNLQAQRQTVEASTKTREVFAGTLFIGDRPVHFHVLKKPDVVYLGSDQVEFIGVFVKVLGYPKSGEPTVSAPFFIAKSLRKYY
jgi:hypothetical protein